MERTQAIEALIDDLRWQVDQLRSRGIKNSTGQPYNPAHYKRGLENAIEEGGAAVAGFVRRYVHKAPSDGFRRLEAADSLDLACEWLVADADKPYADLFDDEDRTAARARLGSHVDSIKARNAARRARIDATRAKLRAKGVPSRPDLDFTLRSRKH